MNIYQSITKILEEVPAIGKNKKNTTQGFMFRGIDDVMNTFQPLLAKHKVFMVPQILEQTREERQTSKGGTLIYSICKIKYIFYAEDGSSIEAIVVGEGMDSGDKATNKAMAIAMKYAMFQVFCIPTEEMRDPDGETPPASKKKEIKIQSSQIQILEKYYIGDNMTKLLNANGLTKLEDMTMAKASEIIKKLKEKVEEK
ncbi:MAG: ERF family protein [Bacilli bacterium]|nr:ERF family protein [Bacilli bacterium]